MLIEVKKKLVVLLYHVCVALVQNAELLGLFFRPTATGRNRFVFFAELEINVITVMILNK